MRLARPALGLLAIVACAWFIIGIRQSADISRASRILSQPKRLTPQQEVHVASLLDWAATLNPDQQVGILRAQLAQSERNHDLAQKLLQAVVRQEPMNLEAWSLLANVSGDKPALQLLAFRHIAQLHPNPHRRG